MIAGTEVTAATQPLGKVVAIDLLGGARAAWIDDSGNVQASSSPLFNGDESSRARVPFTQPIDEVVMVAQVAERNVPGARMGVTYCGRTRAATLECITDYRDIAYRIAPPITGRVTHVGVAQAPLPPLVCVRTDENDGACWLLSPDGRSMQPYAGSAAAVAIATKTPADIAERTGVLHDVGISSSEDDQHVLQGNGSPAVHCGLLASGVLTCVGPGVYGELGDGKLEARVRTSKPLGDARVVDVSVFEQAVCAALADGRVACWGTRSIELPVAKAKLVTLPRCKLDRAESRRRYEAARTLGREQVDQCRVSCRAAPRRDCELNCVAPCNPEPYVFVHDKLCIEPYGVEDTVTARLGDRCSAGYDREPAWLTDAELGSQTVSPRVVPAPAFVPKVSDAAGVALSGRSLCILRRSGAVTCLGD